MKEKIVFAWSGGKDSAFALYELMKSGEYEIVSLLTTITENYDRISMHGVRREMLEAQTRALDLPLEKVFIPVCASIEEYESRMRVTLEKFSALGVSRVAFGDIYLEDLRKDREEKLSQIGMKGIFPIWKRDTSELAHEFIAKGFKTIITCVDTSSLDKKFTGRYFDQRFIEDLPSNVDPCGENGEFHSFVYQSPMFKEEIPFEKGETVLRDGGFCFCDLIPSFKNAVLAH